MRVTSPSGKAKATARCAPGERGHGYINEPSGSVTAQDPSAAADGLPDLSRLSLGSNDGGQGRSPIRQRGDSGHAIWGGQPVVNVHVTVQTQGAPATVNVNATPPRHAVSAGGSGRTIRRTRTAGLVAPPSSPARFRLGGHAFAAPNVGPTQVFPAAHAAPTGPETDTLAPLSPLLHGVHTTAPPSPSLDNVPASPTASEGGQDLVPAGYEHIAPRDDAHHGKWYVVTAGRRVGIWRDWLDMADFVLNVTGNAHKAFRTRTEAEDHYYSRKATGQVWVIMP